MDAIPPDRRIILFRFHDRFGACRERLRLLRHFNPDVPIYGLYGGPHEYWDDARRSVGDAVVHLHMWSAVDTSWKWMHAELAVKEWFRAYGDDVPFDVLYEYEYDMLMCAPLRELYPPLPADGLAFSAVRATEAMAGKWIWITDQRYRPGYLAFCDYMAERYGVDSIERVVLGPGPLLTRRFLTAFCQLEDCDLVHNEIAYPAFAQALGFTLVDNQFYRKESERWFHCWGGSLDWKDIEAELRHGRRRAFHPVKHLVTLEQVIGALQQDGEGMGSDADQPERAAGLDIVEVDSGFMVRQASPLRVHQLNSTASAVLELCDGQATVAEIAEGIADVFSLEALPLAEVTACIDDLRRAGVLADRADPFGFFAAIYCLNLDQRPDRWANALRRFAQLRIDTRVERFSAVSTPDNHHVGCALSWRLMVATARDRGLSNFLGIEDDAIFLDETRDILRRAVAELAGQPWDLLYLGGAAWEAPVEIPGLTALRSPRGLTCTHAVAVNHTAYDRLLAGIPEADGIEEWMTAYVAVDQYLAQKVYAGYYRAYVLNPRVATQLELTPPGGLDAELRDRYTIR
jgi:hypothetical protein